MKGFEYCLFDLDGTRSAKEEVAAEALRQLEVLGLSENDRQGECNG